MLFLRCHNVTMPFLKEIFQYILFNLRCSFLHGCLERKEGGVLPLLWCTVCVWPMGHSNSLSLNVPLFVYLQIWRGFSPASLISLIPLQLPPPSDQRVVEQSGERCCSLEAKWVLLVV